METIDKSVGRGGVNQEADVKTVQGLLNRVLWTIQLEESGKINVETLAAIDFFQSRYLKIKPDGKISPKGPTLVVLNKFSSQSICAIDSIELPSPGNATTLVAADYASVAKELGCEEAVIRAVAEVESRGDGFLSSKRPRILFEAHVFSRLTFHCFDRVYPDVSVRYRDPKLYKGGEEEYDRIIKAMAIDRVAALKSASWGMFQIMGFNCMACGYVNIRDDPKTKYLFLKQFSCCEDRHKA